jgi:hypothetical protein
MRPSWKYCAGVVALLAMAAVFCVLLLPAKKPETDRERLDRLSREFLEQHREQNRKPREMWKQ